MTASERKMLKNMVAGFTFWVVVETVSVGLGFGLAWFTGGDRMWSLLLALSFTLLATSMIVMED